MTKSSSTREILESINNESKRDFKEKNYLLSFDEYLDLVARKPNLLMRSSAQYMKDMIDSFGIEEVTLGHEGASRHLRVFERPRGRNRPPIVGQHEAHEHIYKILEQFVRQGRVDKLILLHGPNGSSKSSTAEALAQALEEYSKTDEGAIYRFNWVFPNDKLGHEGLSTNEAGKKIGFGDSAPQWNNKGTFAHLPDDELLCKIVSELKENPIFLLPASKRSAFIRSCMNKGESDEIPGFLVDSDLSAKNKKIFEALLIAYHGDLEKLFRHVQVERFFFSSRYRTGIATVEPQMTIDAQDKQITMERNLQNIPPVLQNIRFYEPSGDLVDASRGFIEFADLLKRPVEAFKYLLTTVEKMSINLTSGFADLDLVMMGSANEKHLDAFKASPDWPSFKGRFELVRVPYLLSSQLESKIYEEDVRTISRNRQIGPHALDLLAKWAVLTRLRPPDPEFFEFNVRNLVARLDPFEKLALYDGLEPSMHFSDAEKGQLKKLVGDIKRESQASHFYEGRFGASPREMKMLLYFASQHPTRDQVNALAIFDEIENLMRDRSVYDYLQFEPRNGYHDFREFHKFIRFTYAQCFHREFMISMNLFDENQYHRAFEKYLKNIVAFLKKENVVNEITQKLEPPAETIMDEMEQLLGLNAEKRELRESLVAKIASWRVENPGAELDISKVFKSELQNVEQRIYESKKELIERVKVSMLTYGTEDYQKQPAELLKTCEETFKNLESRFGYSWKTTWESLVFLRSQGI
jgi:predicted Ser/Thr protein kinase